MRIKLGVLHQIYPCWFRFYIWRKHSILWLWHCFEMDQVFQRCAVKLWRWASSLRTKLKENPISIHDFRFGINIFDENPYVRYKIESKASLFPDTIYDIIHDCLKLKNVIIRWSSNILLSSDYHIVCFHSQNFEKPTIV